MWGCAGGVQQGGSGAPSAAAARAPAAQHRVLRQDLALPVPRHPTGTPLHPNTSFFVTCTCASVLNPSRVW